MYLLIIKNQCPVLHKTEFICKTAETWGYLYPRYCNTAEDLHRSYFKKFKRVNMRIFEAKIPITCLTDLDRAIVYDLQNEVCYKAFSKEVMFEGTLSRLWETL